jgi:predicted NACHT family NTPase
MGNETNIQMKTTKDIEHTLNDLSDSSKQSILSKKIQGFSIAIQDFGNRELLNKMGLNRLLSGPVEIDQQLKRSEQKFIDRNFCFQILREIRNDVKKSDPTKSTVNILKNSTELINHAEHLKVVIASDGAGVGKTTTISHMAMKFKQDLLCRWVELIDLKKHIVRFEKIQDRFDNFYDFLCATMMNFDGEQDRNLFSTLYSQGKVVLLLDGYDEIPSKLRDLLNKQFESFDSKVGNILMITTGLQSVEDLERVLNKKETGDSVNEPEVNST